MISTQKFIYLDFLRSFRFGKELGLIKRKRKTPLDYDANAIGDQQQCLSRLIKDILKERLKNSIAFSGVPRSTYSRIYFSRRYNNLLSTINESFFINYCTEEEKIFIESIRNLYRNSFVNYNNVNGDSQQIRIDLEYHHRNFPEYGYVYFINTYEILKNCFEIINNYENLCSQLDKFSQIYNTATEKYREEYFKKETITPAPPITVNQIVGFTVDANVPTYTIVAAPPLEQFVEHDQRAMEQNLQVVEQNTQSSFNLALDRWRQRQAER